MTARVTVRPPTAPRPRPATPGTSPKKNPLQPNGAKPGLIIRCLRIIAQDIDDKLHSGRKTNREEYERFCELAKGGETGERQGEIDAGTRRDREKDS
jgi:hypothetical protein